MLKNLVTLEEYQEMLKIKDIILLDFYSDWCGPCKMLARTLETIKDNANIFKINVDNFPSLAQQYKIKSLPTLLMLRDGKVLHRIDGAVGQSEIIGKLEELAVVE